jgi:hypothetical protein
MECSQWAWGSSVEGCAQCHSATTMLTSQLLDVTITTQWASGETRREKTIHGFCPIHHSIFLFLFHYSSRTGHHITDSFSSFRSLGLSLPVCCSSRRCVKTVCPPRSGTLSGVQGSNSRSSSAGSTRVPVTCSAQRESGTSECGPSHGRSLV